MIRDGVASDGVVVGMIEPYTIIIVTDGVTSDGVVVGIIGVYGVYGPPVVPDGVATDGVVVRTYNNSYLTNVTVLYSKPTYVHPVGSNRLVAN